VRASAAFFLGETLRKDTPVLVVDEYSYRP
jgi:hypothetical protein